MKNKTKILSLIIVILCVVIIFLIVRSRKVDAPMIPNEKPLTHGYETIGYTFKKDDVETDTTSIHVTQPIVSGLSSKILNDVVNSQLNVAFSNIKKSFIADTSGVEIFSKDAKHQLILSGEAPLQSSKKVFYVDTEIYSFLSGSAHPLTQRAVYNFVKETGQLIRLEDILKRDTRIKRNTASMISDTNNGISLNSETAVATDADFKTALTGISNLAKPRILAQLNKMTESNGGDSPNGADSFEEEGAEPKLENYSVFYIHEDRIEWVFGQYQVAPYVFGEIKISISMSELAPYLAPRAYLK